MIDLHMHSHFSDGTLSPEDLVAEAVRQRLVAVALTDHDTVEGVGRFVKAAAAGGVQAVSGVEFSTDYGPGHMHLLGYGVDIHSAELHEHLAWIRGGRTARNAEILQKLNTLGLLVREQDVAELSGEGVVGRPHIAEALRLKGYVRSRHEAFKKYLAHGRPAYAPRRNLPPESCIKLIRDSGGVAVLAHPHTLDLSHRDLRALIHDLAAKGLTGVEVYYGRSQPREEKKLLKMAGLCDLLPTGGSDFHGAMSPDIAMGTGRGDLHVPDEVWDDLKNSLDSGSK